MYDKARVERELFCDLRGTRTGAVAEKNVDIVPDSQGYTGWLCERPQADCEFGDGGRSESLWRWIFEVRVGEHLGRPKREVD